MGDARSMARSPLEIPADLRTRLETTRLHLLTLFRALDRMELSAGVIPQPILRQLFERDADCAEALWALDQPEGRVDRRAMCRPALNSWNRALHCRESLESSQALYSFPGRMLQ